MLSHKSSLRVLTIHVAPRTFESLQKKAAEAGETVESLLEDWLGQMLLKSSEKSGRKLRGNSEIPKAPMDAFLPEGADPFVSDSEESGGLSFADIQARMRFAGTPALLR